MRWKVEIDLKSQLWYENMKSHKYEKSMTSHLWQKSRNYDLNS